MLVILNWYWECSRLRKAPDIVVFYAPATKNGERALSVTPVRSCVRPYVRPSVIKIWCPLNNDSIQIWYVDI